MRWQRLNPRPLQMPRPMLTLGMPTLDMVLDTTDTDHTMAVTIGHMDTDTGEEKRGKQKLNPQLLLMLMLILTIMPMVMALDTMDTTDPTIDTVIEVMDIGEKRKGKPKLSPPLSLIQMLKPMLIPGIATMDMVLDIMVTTADLTMVVTTGHTDMDMGTGEERRGKLKLNLKLTQRLMLIPGTVPMDMVLDIMVTTADLTIMVTTGHTDMDMGTGEER